MSVKEKGGMSRYMLKSSEQGHSSLWPKAYQKTKLFNYGETNLSLHINYVKYELSLYIFILTPQAILAEVLFLYALTT